MGKRVTSSHDWPFLSVCHC